MDTVNDLLIAVHIHHNSFISSLTCSVPQFVICSANLLQTEAALSVQSDGHRFELPVHFCNYYKALVLNIEKYKYNVECRSNIHLHRHKHRQLDRNLQTRCHKRCWAENTTDDVSIYEKHGHSYVCPNL